MACRRPSSSTGAGGFAPGTSARSRTTSSGRTSSGCSRNRRDEEATRRRHRARPRGAPQRRRAGARARGVRVPGPRGRRRAPLRRLPEPLGGRLSLGDGASDARDRPRAARGRREPGGGGPVLRRSVRRVDPPLAATTRVQPPRVARAARGRRRRPGDRGRARPAVDATAGVGGDGAVPRSRDARADPARDGGGAVTGILVAALVLGVPALAFVLWPLVGARGRSQALLRLPPDRRGELEERKGATLRALRELRFEHEAGHIGERDYAELRARYEGEAAAVLTELDSLRPAPPTPTRRSRRSTARWRSTLRTRPPCSTASRCSTSRKRIRPRRSAPGRSSWPSRPPERTAPASKSSSPTPRHAADRGGPEGGTARPRGSRAHGPSRLGSTPTHEVRIRRGGNGSRPPHPRALLGQRLLGISNDLSYLRGIDRTASPL